MKKYLITFLVIAFLLTSIPLPTTQASSRFAPPALVSDFADILNWSEYSSAEYGFSLNHPQNWETKVFEVETGAKSFAFSKPGASQNKESRLIVNPVFGFDYGLPFDPPQEFTKTVNGKTASVKKWILQDNSILVHFYFTDDISKWSPHSACTSQGMCSGLDIHAENDADLAILLEMVESMKFNG